MLLSYEKSLACEPHEFPEWRKISSVIVRRLGHLASQKAIKENPNLKFIMDCEDYWPATFLLSTNWSQKVSNFKKIYFQKLENDDEENDEDEEEYWGEEEEDEEE
ncbi:hypothetical protein INT46_003126 [Mucor plumbeus]|uniref:Uncharacterized protein n=1 Tax=Mucor plumbeus TaxID=97098 RepID=A0A8H7QZL3_9FUNG|nr:hypothetical protein INT46_003126 [Mucor plumbeus]